VLQTVTGWSDGRVSSDGGVRLGVTAPGGARGLPTSGGGSFNWGTKAEPELAMPEGFGNRQLRPLLEQLLGLAVAFAKFRKALDDFAADRIATWKLDWFDARSELEGL
jgi:hypothetical protein